MRPSPPPAAPPTTSRSLRVLKFGGSSVADAERLRRVAAVVAGTEARCDGQKPVVVVSALSGVTDVLLGAARRAAAAGPSAREEIASHLDTLRRRHRQTADALLSPLTGESPLEVGEDEEVRGGLERALSELEDLLHGCRLLREASPRTLDAVASYGERLSAPLASAALRRCGVASVAVDARPAVRTDERFGGARVDLETTYEGLRQLLLPVIDDGKVPVLTGFLGSTADGHTTTLGRGGSDYTASLAAAALGAQAVELWTDVAGVLSADPRLVGDSARTLRHLTYPELMELSHFGAKVVHPPSVHPARAARIPLWIKSTFDPGAHGTRVEGELASAPRRGEVDANAPVEQASSPLPVRGITSIPRLALLRVEGDGMVGVPGIAGRIFGALARRDISVVLITQASSEHSISFAIAPEDVPGALTALDEELRAERTLGLVEAPQLEEDVAAVACVGTAMRQRPGVAARVFTTLARRGISARAIAQGSSELNLSVMVDHRSAAAAVRALHRAFFPPDGAPPRRTVDLHLAGVGRVGSALLEQLAQRLVPLEREQGLRLRLASIGGRRGFATAPEGLEGDDPDRPGLDPATAADALENGPLIPLEQLVETLAARPREERIFIDCTASDAIADAYSPLVASGFAIVAANKLPFAGSRQRWAQLRPHRRHLFFEATAGAGLPVIQTLGDLMATGDQLLRVEGLFSGTLSFLLDELHRGVAFSEALRGAYARGFTEPDPREDLSGRDVARKLLILGRHGGLDLALEDIAVTPVLPPDPWASMDLETFWDRLPEVDEDLATRCRQAQAAGQRLVVLGQLEASGDGAPSGGAPSKVASVGLTAIDAEHPAAQVRGSDNLVAFTTRRYRHSPLVVRGPGAGPEVTAAGVFSDILRAVRRG